MPKQDKIVKISDLLKSKTESLRSLKERQALQLERTRASWDKKITLARKRNARLKDQERVAKKKARRAREIGNMSYKRVLYLKVLKEHRSVMEAYKAKKDYTCEHCGMKGYDTKSLKVLLAKDPEGPVQENDSHGREVAWQLTINKKVILVCMRKYIMCHHDALGNFDCMCRWCHDKEDQKLRQDKQSFKAFDKAAVEAEIFRLVGRKI